MSSRGGVRIALGAILLAYPVLIYFGLAHFEPWVLSLVLAALALLRYFASRANAASGVFSWQLLVGSLVLLTFGLLSAATNSIEYLRFYPLCINLLLFAVFFASLLRPPSVVERLARLREPQLSQSGVRYTRNVTKVWCCFFLANGAVSLYTALAANMKIWAFYNGFLSYVLIAMLFLFEYLFRQWWRGREGS